MIFVKKTRGFSLIEVIVAVSILVILAGIAIPAVSSQVEKAKVGKLISLVDTLRQACEQYKVDTNAYAIEYSGDTYTAAVYHRLSLSSTVNGWDGPYIDHPITVADNPFNSTIYMYSSLTSVPDGGFDINGSGGLTHQGPGNYIRVYGLTENTAQRLNDSFDGDIPGNWQVSGRVKYSGNVLYVYLSGGY